MWKEKINQYDDGIDMGTLWTLFCWLLKFIKWDIFILQGLVGLEGGECVQCNYNGPIAKMIHLETNEKKWEKQKQWYQKQKLHAYGQHIARPLGAMRLFLILGLFNTACWGKKTALFRSNVFKVHFFCRVSPFRMKSEFIAVSFLPLW
jgi:hypothetical protein